jgi:hypothetical protein
MNKRIIKNQINVPKHYQFITEMFDTKD